MFREIRPSVFATSFETSLFYAFLGVKLCKNQNIPNLPISNFVPSWRPRFFHKANFSVPLSTSRFDQHHSMPSPSWVSGNCNDEIQHTENQGQKPSEFHSTLNEVESWGERNKKHLLRATRFRISLTWKVCVDWRRCWCQLFKGRFHRKNKTYLQTIALNPWQQNLESFLSCVGLMPAWLSMHSQSILTSTHPCQPLRMSFLEALFVHPRCSLSCSPFEFLLCSNCESMSTYFN